MRLFAKDLLDEFLDHWDTRGTTDQNDFVDFRGAHARVLEALIDRATAAFNQTIDELLKLGARDVFHQVFWSCGVCRDEREVDARGCGGAKLFLRFFACFLKTLKGHRILTEVDTVRTLEIICDVSDQSVVEIITAEVTVTAGADDLADTFRDVQAVP